jgi:hypothetical protein
VQEAIDAAIAVIGRGPAQRLWAPLLAEQAEQPVKLQWLPLLACWLTCPPSYTAAVQESAAQHASTTPPAAMQHDSALPSPGKGSPRPKKQDGKPGSSPHSAQSSPRRKREGKQDAGQQPQAPEMTLDQHAEQAFQLQEAAMRAGYAAAALPLWENFLWRFFSHQVLSCLFVQEPPSCGCVQA